MRHKVANYQKEDWVAALYEQWEQYIRTAISNGLPIEEIFLKPDPHSIMGDIRWEVAGPEGAIVKFESMAA
ncbi:MAG: hypothetical protein ACREC3_16190 [Methyloceanibacter sp.]